MTATLSSAEQPNVVVIHCHDLGRCLGCYGESVSTPNVDRLSADGARFSNYFCTAPHCSPSRGSIWTGQYPHNHGLMGLAGSGWTLDDGVPALPQCFRDAGYRTHLVGLQHVSPSPRALGYDTVVSYEGASDGEGNDAAGVAREFATRVRNWDRTERHFASVGIYEPHRPFPESDTDPANIAVPQYLPDEPAVREDLGGLHAAVTRADAAVGTIVQSLEKAAVLKNTIVVFTTDHGIAFPRAKGMCYDPGVETALVVRYPDAIETGETYDQLLSNVDLAPTLLRLIGEDPPPDMDGESFAEILSEDGQWGRDHVFLEMTWHDYYNPIRAVRTEQFKYVRNFWQVPLVYLPNDVFLSASGRIVREEWYTQQRPKEELYDLDADPHEHRNLAEDESHREVLERLREVVRHRMVEDDDPLRLGPVQPPADRTDFSCPVCDQ